MNRYTIHVREIHFSRYEVEAESIEEAIETVNTSDNGFIVNGGLYLDTDYSETLPVETWLIDEYNKDEDSYTFYEYDDNKEKWISD